jgi:hypothetical protein
MYVTTPSAKEPEIAECEIKDNTIIYNVQPLTEEGITEMQLKLVESRIPGAKSVLLSPKFCAEVSQSEADDEVEAVQSQTFTTLENSIARAMAVYNTRLLRIEVTEELIFRAYFADGSVYETDAIYEVAYKAGYLMSQSYAVGGTGIREGEDTDNSKYYSSVARTEAMQAQLVTEGIEVLLDEARLLTNYVVFGVDFESGELTFTSPNDNATFSIDQKNGNLIIHKGEAYTPEALVGEAVDAYMDEQAQVVIDTMSAKSEEVDSKLAEQDAQITQLASTIPVRQVGTASLTRTASTVTFAEVVFETPFATVPIVSVTAKTDDPMSIRCSVGSVTVNGFTIYCYSEADGDALSADWIAMV